MKATRLMAAADGTVWLFRHTSRSVLQARRYQDRHLGHVALELEATGGYDAVLDSEGCPWIVWAPDSPVSAHIHAVKYEGGAWGPRHQITTQGGNRDPAIAADEYGNVWIFWLRAGSPGEIWMCRMGPRSGQETFVVKGADAGPSSVMSVQGRLLVTFLRDGDQWLVEGTEHQGFGEPVKVSAP